jgi:type III restriction enzyme
MKLKFKKQRYQEDAALSVVNVFKSQPKQDSLAYLLDKGCKAMRWGMEQLPEDQGALDEGYANALVKLSSVELLDNIHEVQRSNNIQESEKLSKGIGACQLDIEMETGTGKTYVYTKTMFELNIAYGWTKFIIVVPGIAIREGVYKSLQSTEQHFFEEYGKKIDYFVYDSSNLTELDRFSESPDICAMIINMQAFNTSMKENANNKQARIIFSERDEFGSRRPIDVIAANRPIIIQDEPQKMGGKATQEGIKHFNPLFCLNYSATHRVHHDTVYILDALDAYNQRLIKRIEVKGFELKNIQGTNGYLYLRDFIVSKNTPPTAVIEHRRLSASGSVSTTTGRFGVGDDIYVASGEMEVYRDYQIAPDGVIPDVDGQLARVRFLNGVTIVKGQIVGDSSEDDMRRVQIRETIKSHLQKESSLFFRHIKCLSLFFIDEVAKYRNVDDPDSDEPVGYRKMFEEEYQAAVDEFLDGRIEDDYSRYLRGISAHETNEGYFSIDKRGHQVESSAEKKTEREEGIGVNDENALRAYDLILKDKELLLSFDEPVRFIFSHSALREGWDNPNIFQICTLRHSDSETGKRQEVGRGLRLCVNDKGERQDLETLGEDEVQRVNVLTVIAPESYAEFVGALQKDISSGLRERPTVVTDALFTNRKMQDADKENMVTLTAEDARHISFVLAAGGYVDMDGHPTEKFRKGDFAEEGAKSLPESLVPYAGDIEKLVRSVYDPHALDGMISDGLESKLDKNRLNDNFHKREFQELWRRINRKHAYTVSFDDEELRRKSIAHIDSKLNVSTLSYTLTTGSQKVRVTREDLAKRDQFGDRTTETYELDSPATTSVTYDLVGEVAQGANITRRSAALILEGISPLKFAMFRRNPEEFIAKVVRAIVAEKATMVVEHIQYHTLDKRYDESIFTERMPENVSHVYEAIKNIQDYVVFDSEIEHDFAQDMDAANEVCVYARLPRGFQIPTPVGDYAPD